MRKDERFQPQALNGAEALWQAAEEIVGREHFAPLLNAIATAAKRVTEQNALNPVIRKSKLLGGLPAAVRSMRYGLRKI